MAAYHGRSGVIKVDGTAMGEIVSWSYNESANKSEAPAMGQTSKRKLAGLKDAEGQIVVNFDDGDTEQALLVVGAEVAIELHQRGTGSGLPMLTSTGNPNSGKVSITSREESGDTDSVLQVTIGFDNELLPGTQV